MKTVLIVEDDLFDRKALLDKFQREKDLEIIVAENGKEGLAMALERHPDIILLDIIMPIMDGITMLQELRKDTWGAEVPVLILTNLSDGIHALAANKNNVHDYLIKTNYSLDDVVKLVKERLHITTS